MAGYIAGTREMWNKLNVLVEKREAMKRLGQLGEIRKRIILKLNLNNSYYLKLLFVRTFPHCTGLKGETTTFRKLDGD